MKPTIATTLPGLLHQSTMRKSGMHEAQLARALSKAANPMLIIDRASSIMWCNEAYCQMIDLPADKMLKRKPSCLAPSRDNGKYLTDLWTVVMSGHIWKGELSERKSDGTMVHLDAVMTPLDDAQGKPALFMLFLHDITERKNRYDDIWRMANHDRLTGLPNRNFFLSMLDHTLATNQRNGSQCALLYLDLDGFKAANDTYGHDVGDMVLQSAAELLKANVRRSDFVARLGGDEFVCILTEVAQAQDAGDVASKIIHAMSLMTNVGGRHVKIGASIGVAVYPDDAMDGDALIKSADTAMYAAKRDGKNCWRKACAPEQERGLTS